MSSCSGVLTGHTGDTAKRKRRAESHSVLTLSSATSTVLALALSELPRAQTCPGEQLALVCRASRGPAGPVWSILLTHHTSSAAEHAPVTCVTLLASAAVSVVSLAGRRGTPLDVVRVAVCWAALTPCCCDTVPCSTPTTCLHTGHTSRQPADGVPLRRVAAGVRQRQCVLPALWLVLAVAVVFLWFGLTASHAPHCSGVRLRLWPAVPLPCL